MSTILSSRNLEQHKRELKEMAAGLSARGRQMLEDFKARKINPTVGALVEALGSDYFPRLTLDALHNRLVGRYRGVMSEWRRIANVTSVSDFQLHHATAVSGVPDLETVLENGEYKYVTREDEARGSYAVTKRGNIFSMSLEAQANDALGALMDSAASFGLSSARTLDKHCLTTNLSDNPVIYDGIELVGSSHSNWGGSGGLTDTNLEAAIELMLDQDGISGTDDETESYPVALIVPVDEVMTAKRIVNSDRIREVAASGVLGEVNPLQGLVEVVPSRRIASGRRFLVANPSECDMLEVGFFRGMEEPETFIENDGAPAEFETDARRVKVRHIWGTAWRDYRGVVGWGFADPH